MKLSNRQRMAAIYLEILLLLFVTLSPLGALPLVFSVVFVILFFASVFWAVVTLVSEN